MPELQRTIERPHQRRWPKILFLAGVWAKGVDGALEIAAAAGLLSVTPAAIRRLVGALTQDEILADPHDWVGTYLRRAAAHISFASEHFLAAYLFIHGAVKVLLVWALLRRFLGAYPLSMAIFAVFVAYQLYRYSSTGSLGLLALSAFDLLVIGLIGVEYRALLQELRSVG
jgi:uncharacterized membrane protein